MKSSSKITQVIVLVLLILGFSASSYASLSDGLVAYYPFSGNAYDESGNGHHGRVNGAVLSEDRFGIAGGAYRFDSYGAHIMIDHSNDLNFSRSEDFSLVIWVKIDSIQNAHTWTDNDIVSKWRSYVDVGYPYVLRYFNQDSADWGHIYVARHVPPESPSPGGIIISSIRLDDNQFHHIVFKKQNMTLSLYIDGLLDGVTADLQEGDTTNELPLTFGIRTTDFTSYFNGAIDEVRIYNRALSESEIKMLYSPSMWDVPYLSQLDYPNNMKQSACGPTSIAMLLMYYYPNSHIDMPEIYHSGTQSYRYLNGPAYYYRNVSFACSLQYGCDSRLTIINPYIYRRFYVGTYSGMNVDSMRNYLINIWGIQTTQLTTIDDVYREIQRGPLLGHVFALGNRIYGHFLVIRGIDDGGTPHDRTDDYIIVNNPNPYRWNQNYNGNGYRISYKDFFVGSKGKVKWFRDAYKLDPIDSYSQRMYTLVVDTGNNDFEGNAIANIFQLDDPDGKSAKGNLVWGFNYGGGMDSYSPTEGGHSATWTPKLNKAGTYQVSVHFKAGGGDVTYTVYDNNHNALGSVIINQSINSSTATCDLRTGWCSSTIADQVFLENGSYVTASNIAAKSNIDAIKFKYLF